MSQIRVRTIKKELVNLQIEINCAVETLEKIDLNFFEINDAFDDRWDDVADSLHTAKLIANRVNKQIKDYKKSIENKKNIKIVEISV